LLLALFDTVSLAECESSLLVPDIITVSVRLRRVEEGEWGNVIDMVTLRDVPLTVAGGLVALFIDQDVERDSETSFVCDLSERELDANWVTEPLSEDEDENVRDEERTCAEGVLDRDNVSVAIISAVRVRDND
jgi:hypothetical protein